MSSAPPRRAGILAAVFLGAALTGTANAEWGLQDWGELVWGEVLVAAPGFQEASSRYELRPIGPSPFNGFTTVEYAVAEAAHVNLKVVSVTGRLVRKLDSKLRDPGRFRVVWDGRDEAGRPVASGTYFYVMNANSFRQTRRVVVLR